MGGSLGGRGGGDQRPHASSTTSTQVTRRVLATGHDPGGLQGWLKSNSMHFLGELWLEMIKLNHKNRNVMSIHHVGKLVFVIIYLYEMRIFMLSWQSKSPCLNSLFEKERKA